MCEWPIHKPKVLLGKDAVEKGIVVPDNKPIDKLWERLTIWGISRKFEDGSKIIEVILKKDEFEKAIRDCYDLEQKI